MMTWTSENRQTAACCLMLFAVTFLLFSSSLQNEFLVYGDSSIIESKLIQEGPSAAALYKLHSSGWHPLATLAHQFDYALFESNPAGYRTGNLLLHSASAVLCLLLALRLGASLPAAMVIAAIFAWHPLRVESVVWIAQRKDLLSTFFCLLALHAYWLWAKDSSRPKYAMTVIACALAMLSHITALILPFLMLLLDFWPLKRFPPPGDPTAKSSINRLIREKVPFFLMAGLLGIITLSVQKRPEGLLTFEEFDLLNRFVNSVASFGRQLDKLFRPMDLAVFYSQMPGTSFPAALLSLIVLSAAFALGWRKRETHPQLIFGCVWFLLCLFLPGIMQSDRQAMADRHSYLASFGILFALVTLPLNTFTFRSAKKMVFAIGSVAAITCLMLTHDQIKKWHGSETLMNHALEVTRDNFVAHDNLGDALIKRGDPSGAVEHYLAAAKIRPSADIHFKAGRTLLSQGKPALAEKQLIEALQLKFTHAEAHFELALALTDLDRVDDGAIHLMRALSLDPSLNQRIYIPPEKTNSVERPATNPPSPSHRQ